MRCNTSKDVMTSNSILPTTLLMLILVWAGSISAQEMTRFQELELMNSNRLLAEDIDLERVLLSWCIQAESDVDHFIIERSVDAEAWELVRDLPRPKNKAEQLHIETVDSEAIIGDSFYRITQVDSQGEKHFTAITPAQVKKRPSVEFFPNPANSIVTIYADDPELMDVELVDSSGKHVRAYVDRFGEVMQINVESLKPGTYLLHVSSPARSDVQAIMIY
jgi:hypothetical protein